MKTKFSIYLICSLLLMNIAGNGQIIDDYLANPISVRILSGYKFNPLIPTNTFQNWIIPSPNAYLVNSSGAPDASVTVNPKYVKWKNVEASAYPDSCILQVQYTDYLNVTRFVSRAVGPFTLTFKTITFVGGSSKNIPCYATTPVTIALDNYINTDNNYPFDKNLWITRHFEWTLPSGWQTTAGQTGTFVGLSSIMVIPPSSNSTVSISVRAKANTQYSQPSTLQITRNLENFLIEGQTTATCYSTKRYTAPASSSGVTYSWQLPSGWTGVASQNYIDATVTGSSGNITCTMTGCGQSKVSTKSITVTLIESGTIISGPSPVCSSGSTFSVSTLPQVDSIIWSTGPYLSVNSGQNTNSPTIKATGSGSSWVKVRLVTACGSVTLPQKNVWAGTPVISYISGSTYTPNYQWATYYAQPNNSQMAVTDYEWILNPLNGNSVYDYGWTADIAFYNSGYYQVVARAQNTCGWGSYAVLGVEVYDSKSLSFSPNPTSSETILSIESTSEEKVIGETEEWELEIYDNVQNLKEKQTNLKGNSTKLQTAGWKEGVYLVRVKYKNEILTGKLVVKK